VVAGLFERLRRNRVLARNVDAGGIEAVYDDVPKNIGLMAFAPVVPARGPMFGAAARAEKEFGERPVLSEEELYGEPET
jgi:hypothetical protein